jgi:hypothetical protein
MNSISQHFQYEGFRRSREVRRYCNQVTGIFTVVRRIIVSMVEEVIPDSLMKQIRELATREGVTVEQFISAAAAEKAAAWMMVEYLRARATRGARESFERAIARVPDAEPEEDDRV